MAETQGYSPLLAYVEFDGVEISATGMESFDPQIGEETAS